MLRKYDLVEVVGQSKVGKSYFAYQLAQCIASGIPFLGHNIKEKCRVVYVDYEMAAYEISQRAKQISDFYRDTTEYETMPLVKTRTPPRIVGRRLKQMAEEDPGHHLVAIFDNYSSFAEGDENSAQDTKLDLLPFQELKNYMTVIYIHHRNKAGTGSAINTGSGSGVHGRTCDHTITIDHNEKEQNDRGYSVAVFGRKFYDLKTVCCKMNGLFVADEAEQQAYDKAKEQR